MTYLRLIHPGLSKVQSNWSKGTTSIVYVIVDAGWDDEDIKISGCHRWTFQMLARGDTAAISIDEE